MDTCVNRVTLTGTVDGELAYSHSAFGEAFYTTLIRVTRLSGAEDVLPVTVSERVLCPRELQDGCMVAVEGQLRSYNKYVDGASRLILTVFVHRVEMGDCPANDIELSGYICKPPTSRVTPFSREITDLLIAVNRAYGKSDYIPAITWGRNARFAKNLPVGAKVFVKGRVQSREYRKLAPDGSATIRTAYEVSVSLLETEETL